MGHVIIPPSRMPFGDYIRCIVRRVAAVQAERVTVCCQPSRRFMFPSMSDFVDAPERMSAADEAAVLGQAVSLHPQAEVLVIRHSHPEADVVLNTTPAHVADVVIGPRFKPAEKFAHRNWAHWPRLCEMIQFSGCSVVAVGSPIMSAPCPCPLISEPELIVQAMIGARLTVAIDSGISHLAVLARAPLALIWGSPVGVIPGQLYEQGCHMVMEKQKRAPVYHLGGAWASAEAAMEQLEDLL